METTHFNDREKRNSVVCPKLSKKLEKLRYAKLHGAPHETPATGDPYHASVALRKRDDYKGSGLSLHIYPDGLVKPSKAEFPTLQIALPPEEDQSGSSSKGKQNEEVQAGSSHQSSSKHKSSEKGKGKGKESSGSGYEWDPSSGRYYRYDEHGRSSSWWWPVDIPNPNGSRREAVQHSDEDEAPQAIPRKRCRNRASSRDDEEGYSPSQDSDDEQVAQPPPRKRQTPDLPKPIRTTATSPQIQEGNLKALMKTRAPFTSTKHKRRHPYADWKVSSEIESLSGIDPLSGPNWNGAKASMDTDYISDGGRRLDELMASDAVVRKRFGDAETFFLQAERVAKEVILKEMEMIKVE